MTAIDTLQKSETTDEIFSILQKLMQEFGFLSLTLGLLKNPDIAKQDIQTFMRTDLPQAIQDLWLKEDMIFHDPVVKYALQNDGSFLWSEALEYASKYSLKISDMHAHYDMLEGLAISSRAKGFPRGLFSMAHQNPTALGIETLALVELACTHAYNCLLRVTKANQEHEFVTLTKRETDVLTLVAGGKTNWEIAQIYNISESAIKKHMQNIQNKLQASNRVHASVLAIKTGQIFP